ncbi:MAG: 50S ribosomal protein L10 [Patescibacteria group bacterium]
MAKSRAQKEVAMHALIQNFKDAVSVAFADYRGLTVAKADALRKKMRESDVRYMVAKKSLVTRAAKEAGYDVNAKQFDGMLGVAFGIKDEVAPAKALGDIAKDSPLKIVGGIFEGAVVDKEKVIALSKLPSKQDLLGMLVGTMYAPVSAFARVLNSIREAREASSSAKATEDSGASLSAEAMAEVATEVVETPVAEEAAIPAVEETPVTEESATESTEVQK